LELAFEPGITGMLNVNFESISYELFPKDADVDQLLVPTSYLKNACRLLAGTEEKKKRKVVVNCEVDRCDKISHPVDCFWMPGYQIPLE
jgi:hypothetical protein